MLTDCHRRYTERCVGNRAVCVEGQCELVGNWDWEGRIYGVESMRTSSVEGKV